MNSDQMKRRSFWMVWGLAARPKTLPAGIVPVLVGGAMAYGDGGFHWPSLTAALFASVMIQVGTNYANDLFDYIKRTDDSERIGPMRVTQAGLATPRQTATAALTAFSLAFLVGVYLVTRGGWPIVIIGLASIICGILYTAGPLALGYIGVADFFVLVFFGPVALAGTYYVQTLNISWPIIIAGLPFGMISTAILVVNNLRDISTDRKSGKRTLAARYGRSFARYQYFILLIGAATMAVAMSAWISDNAYLSLAALFLIFSRTPIKTVFTKTDGESLNNALAATGGLLIIYGILFGLGWLL